MTKALVKEAKSGTVLPAEDIDFTNDLFKRTAETDPGYYVYWGMWKGPFPTADDATEAYREWRFEARVS